MQVHAVREVIPLAVDLRVVQEVILHPVDLRVVQEVIRLLVVQEGQVIPVAAPEVVVHEVVVQEVVAGEDKDV